jgi:hypothetical protein
LKILAIIFFFLWTGSAFAQPAVRIPEGEVVTYGPYAFGSAQQRRADISFIAATNTFTFLTLSFEYSTDNGGSWHWYGMSLHPGGQGLPLKLGSYKELPIGVVATHVRVKATSIGGDVTLVAVPTMRIR